MWTMSGKNLRKTSRWRGSRIEFIPYSISWRESTECEVRVFSGEAPFQETSEPIEMRGLGCAREMRASNMSRSIFITDGIQLRLVENTNAWQCGKSVEDWRRTIVHVDICSRRGSRFGSIDWLDTELQWNTSSRQFLFTHLSSCRRHPVADCWHFSRNNTH